ncbi:MAG: DUF4815 domain-containing protein [Desulfobacterales bacterium]|nr:DUF4815 domain-containing protein [Desulfobacterales bacterium]
MTVAGQRAHRGAQGLIYIDGHHRGACPARCSPMIPAKIRAARTTSTPSCSSTTTATTRTPCLINPATGEPTAEREKWVALAQGSTTRAREALPNNVTQRKVVAIHKFDRETGRGRPPRSRRSPTSTCRTCWAPCPEAGSRSRRSRRTSSPSPPPKGLNSLLQNLAERTFDQAGSYLGEGPRQLHRRLNDGENVEVDHQRGPGLHPGLPPPERTCPPPPWCPSPSATKSVRGEQKTFVGGTSGATPCNCTPLKETTQVEAIVEIISNITRGSVGGGEDLLVPNPVVDILEVSQGATVFQEGVDWQQSGNHVDWLGSRQRAGHRHHLHRALDLRQANGQGYGLRRWRLVRTSPAIRRRA